jgi:hypothetical protein
MADNLDSLSGDLVESKKAILSQRRCIILAIVGATPSNNNTLASVLQNGFLSTVKSWLDNILGGSVGELALSFLRVAAAAGFVRAVNCLNIFSQFSCCFDHINRNHRSFTPLADKHYQAPGYQVCSKGFWNGKSNRID